MTIFDWIGIIISLLWIIGICIGTGMIFTDNYSLGTGEILLIAFWPIMLFAAICILPFLPIALPFYFLGVWIAKRNKK